MIELPAEAARQNARRIRQPAVAGARLKGALPRRGTLRQLRRLALLVALLYLEALAEATLLTDTTQICPVCSTTNTFETWASFGSYVYDRPSKYDLVFFPEASEASLWMCASCGYAQVAQEFGQLTKRDAALLRQALREEWHPQASTNVSFLNKLERTIRTNELLHRNKDFWKWFNRVVIFHYRTHDPAKSRQFAQSEVLLLEKEMFPTKETLYLLGEYHRMLGHTVAARNYFRRASTTFVNRPMEISLIAVTALLAASTGFLLGRLKRKLLVKASIAVAAGILLIGSFRLYESLKRLSAPDSYYDQLIQDRMHLARTNAPTAHQNQSGSNAPATGP
jgi:hypothetical protein